MSYTPKGKPPGGGNAPVPGSPGSETYRCENYIQAVTLQDNLHALTGKTYAIKADGQTGWLLTVAACDDQR